jgi:hypothetical protein
VKESHQQHLRVIVQAYQWVKRSQGNSVLKLNRSRHR